MKTKILTITLLLTLLFSALGINKVYAQEPECRDAAGAVIPCPPTDPSTGGGGSDSDSDDNDDNNGGGGGGGNQNPPVTVVTPTSTPLPLSVAPTSTPLPDEDYLGSCSNADGNVFDCFEKFKCEDGLLVIEVDLYADGGTKYDFYCIPDGNIPQLNLPLTIPDPGGKDDNWSGGCNNDGLDACLDLMSSLCSEDGGEISIWYDDEGAGVYCQNQSEAGQVVPTATQLAVIAPAPEDNSTTGGSWDEECSWATCWMSDLACWSEGGKGYGVEDSVGNTGYHCDLPAGSTSGNNLKQLGLATIVLVLIGMLVPAVQKVREAAARSKANSHSAKVDLINKDDDSTEASDYLLEIDGIKGESKAHIKKAKLFVRKQGTDQHDY